MSSIISSKSISKSFSRTGRILRSQYWTWPLLAAVPLLLIGWFVWGRIDTTIKTSKASELQTILDADVEALKLWLHSQENNAEVIASNETVRKLAQELIQLAAIKDSTPITLLQSEQMAQLREELKPHLLGHGYQDFIMTDESGRVLAAQQDEFVVKGTIRTEENLLETVFEGANSDELIGRATVTRPNRRIIDLSLQDGNSILGAATMFAVAPIRTESQKPIAAIGFRIRPEEDFTRILALAQAGKSGETYAFDREGVLLSQSRFDDQLKKHGLLQDRKDVRSILNLQIRDPEVNLTRGEVAAKSLEDRPLTRMAADAVQGKSGVDVEGYRDYRGVQVIGAWTWLDDYDMGIATEVDVDEAFQLRNTVRAVFCGLLGLLLVAAIGLLVLTVTVSRLRRKAQKAAIEARQLGQYTLEEKIGAGGMGTVYKAHHSMLRRPTAVKLLDVDQTNDESIARFELEVQHTSQLNHPNTIAVYDFGRTPEGIFYYAMEYLDGIDLDRLVENYGPQPEGRVIYVLKQICGSLAEAHETGLIHRDVKPANVILNKRGGLYDFAKLLDFGLVKAVDTAKQANLTAANSVVGTPHYLSPESIDTPNEVDPRSDLYSVGALAYFLLAGKPPFEGNSILEVLKKQLNEVAPEIPDQEGQSISEDLNSLIRRCLAKDSRQRPKTAREIIKELDQCSSATAWDQEKAAMWWSAYLGDNAQPTSPTTQAVVVIPDETTTFVKQ